jgi:TPR repeat protein
MSTAITRAFGRTDFHSLRGHYLVTSRAAEVFVAEERGEKITDERFAELLGSARFIAAAESGDMIAEHALVGLFIQKGDHVQALRWLKRAAEHGHPDAQRQLGMRYFRGEGVPQNHSEAASWYIRATQQGDVPALSMAGALYWLGQGVPQDFVEAHKWYNLAAAEMGPRYDDGGDRDKVAAKMTPAQVAEAQARAARWKAVPEPSPCGEVFKRAIRERLQR